jgi:hypothetical protein
VGWEDSRENRGSIVVRDPGAPPAGMADQDILKWIEENQYILVTENRSTMPQHLSNHFTSGKHIPGKLWVHPGVGIRRIIGGLYLICLSSLADEYKDRAIYIPLD